MERRLSPGGLLDAALALVAGGAAALTALPMLGRWWWGFDLASHFAAYAALAGLALPLAVLRRRPGAVAVLAFSFLSSGARLASIYGPAPAGEATLSVLHFNVHTDNPRRREILDHVLGARADLVFLLEIGPDWGPLLAGLDGWVVEARPSRDNFGLAVLARPPARIRFVSDGPFSIPTAEVEIERGGHAITVAGIHPVPPVGADYAAARDAHLAAVAARVRTSARAWIVAGDFNATPWSVPYRDFERESGLRRAQRGYDATWGAGLVRLPIDHTLHSPVFSPTEVVIGPALGSDHDAVLARFAFVR